MIWQKILLNIFNIMLTVTTSINIPTKDEGLVEDNPVETRHLREWQHLLFTFIQLVAWANWKKGNLQHNLQNYMAEYLLMCRKSWCSCWAGEKQFTNVLIFVSNMLMWKCQLGILLALLLAIFTDGKVNSWVVFGWSDFHERIGKGKVRGVHFYRGGLIESW